MSIDVDIRTRKVWLAVEYVVLFFGVAGAYAVVLRGVSPLPVLLVVALAVTAYLCRSGFDRRSFGRIRALADEARSMIAAWSAAAVGLAIVVAVWQPAALFELPREDPLLWLLILVFYPLVSVYPQELLYRAFLFHRYAPVFGDGPRMVAASAAAFGFVHILFGSWISVLLSGVAGCLFAERFRRTRSLVAVSVEHALYGILVFTVGLGQFFYHGATAN
ncbi:CPBP family intramembrane glutamic endopeptidase [Nocardia sp. CC201C]|uniref:CPBP family intramembrane glutamic endopeptidase n=1 Tax=Nocardia sp. CC201C TaxID=3044575 RepID=UPI0024A9A434|nr:CPBP family intramembrane glutamic endopeptidase [Nocardia sp. CC201C]